MVLTSEKLEQNMPANRNNLIATNFAFDKVAGALFAEGKKNRFISTVRRW